MQGRSLELCSDPRGKIKLVILAREAFNRTDREEGSLTEGNGHSEVNCPHLITFGRLRQIDVLHDFTITYLPDLVPRESRADITYRADFYERVPLTRAGGTNVTRLRDDRSVAGIASSSYGAHHSTAAIRKVISRDRDHAHGSCQPSHLLATNEVALPPQIECSDSTVRPWVWK